MPHSMAVPELDAALRATGELLVADGSDVAIVVVGGAALVEAEPMPAPLRDAIATVARDLDLPPDWMNAVVGRRWPQGLPPGLLDEVAWREFGGLRVGLAGRRALIALKLFAAADRGPSSVHVQDLIALAPDDAELDEAATWVRGQDAAPGFGALVDGVISHVRHDC